MKIAPAQPEVVTEEISIVLLGDFNPKIFQPMWFSKESLLRDTEASEATVGVVHPDVTSFSVDWCAIQVTREQFSASIKADAYKSHLVDLVRGVFQRLAHTPVRHAGLNFQQRAKFKSTNDWHAFGHFIIPKSPWKGVAQEPGMRAVQVQSSRANGLKGHTLVIVEPDLRTASDAVVRVNDHYDYERDMAHADGAWISTLLERHFDESVARSNGMIVALIGNFLKTTDVDDGK